MTGPVEDVRWCPWEGRWLPVDHPCVGDTQPDDEPDPEQT